MGKDFEKLLISTADIDFAWESIVGLTEGTCPPTFWNSMGGHNRPIIVHSTFYVLSMANGHSQLSALRTLTGCRQSKCVWVSSFACVHYKLQFLVLLLLCNILAQLEALEPAAAEFGSKTATRANSLHSTLSSEKLIF